jgi:hypothetical protein
MVEDRVLIDTSAQLSQVHLRARFAAKVGLLPHVRDAVNPNAGVSLGASLRVG